MKSITVYETVPNPNIKDKLEVMARAQVGRLLTISVLQAYCAVMTEYGIPSDFVRKSTASLQIITTAFIHWSFISQFVLHRKCIQEFCKFLNQRHHKGDRTYYDCQLKF